MRRKLLIAGALLVALCLGATLIWWFSHGKTEPVSVVKVELAAVRDSVSTNGKVEADRIFELRAPFAGVCRQISTREGDLLKAGQPLLSIDDSALQSDLVAAKAELQAAQSDQANILRGPGPEELNQAEADAARLRLELESARKILTANEWLLQKEAISRFDMEQSQREVARLQQALDAATTRQKDIKARVTEADRKRASARIDAAGARIRYLEDMIARGTLRAPVNGTLFQFELKDGTFLSTGEVVGLLADLSRLRVRVFVDEPDLGQVRVGSAILIHWDARPQDSWKGTVLRIPSQVVARGSRSVADVLGSIESPMGALLPNVSVDVEIQTAAGPKVASLPRSAVFPDGKGHFVWTIRDGRVAKKLVETGLSTPNLIAITGGLSVGDRVILPGESPIIEGMRVRADEKPW
jgi:multidrug efflux pump subunit AcrA (membrane-fusion protein)